MTPFFSIITPVYNCKRFIKKCIQSVLNQSYDFWELILIDDGSTDGSGEICDSYCYDKRIKVIHQNNAGALVSRINGINIAKGIYELGLDADDYLDKDCLLTIKNAIDISGCDLIFFAARYIGSQKGILKCTLDVGTKYSKKEILKEVIKNTNHALWNKAIRMDKVKQARYNGLNKRLSINLDYAQIIPILCNIDAAYVIENVLYNYRVYENSISHACKVQHIFDTAIVTKYVIYKLKEFSLLDIEIYNMIYQAYLEMIGFRILKLFCEKNISKKDCKDIHKSRIYINSKKVESLKNFKRFDFIILKLFRYKQYWAIKFITKM